MQREEIAAVELEPVGFVHIEIARALAAGPESRVPCKSLPARRREISTPTTEWPRSRSHSISRLLPHRGTKTRASAGHSERRPVGFELWIGARIDESRSARCASVHARTQAATLRIPRANRSARGSSALADSSGILCCSVSQAPISMSRQRSLQKGRNCDAADHSTSRRHVGHLTIEAIGHPPDFNRSRSAETAHPFQRATGRAVASSQFKKRMVQRCWLALISGNNSESAGKVTRTNWHGFSRSNCSWKMPPTATSDLRLAF